MLGRCTKSDDGFEYMTGTWQREGAAVEYVFFDDSRFHQSDIPGGQWIWEQSAGRVDLLGNPRRIWRVRFHAADEVTVIESDTFKIYRK